MTMVIHLSDAAADRITELMTDAYDIGLRIEVAAGGCSGYQYKFSKVALSNEEDDDIIIENKQAKLYIDPASAEILEGATVDYVSEILRQEFVIVNPNSAFCGCGKSFS